MSRPTSLQVRTATGDVEGHLVGDSYEFRGIPFAGPIGDVQRFKAPTPPSPWSGVLRAERWPPMTPQRAVVTATGDPLYGDVFGPDYSDEQSESGLYVNVWTPGAGGPERPVLVFLHGGGLTSGQATRPRENGARLAAQQDIVVVAPSHRLGMCGYLYLASLSEEYAANVGMVDLVAALRWVRDNIQHFGGDPDNVTIMGESGGSLKVATLLAMPAASGLFHRAICQSGAYPMGAIAPVTLEVAQDAARRTLHTLGVRESELHALADIPLPALLDGGTATLASFTPVIEPGALPVTPSDVAGWKRGDIVPLLIGTDRDEMRVISTFMRLAPCLEEFRSQQGVLGNNLIRYYADTQPELPYAGLRERVMTDTWYRLPALSFADAMAANGAEVYMYLFTWENPARPDVGASHGTETPFIFNAVSAVPALAHAPGTDALATSMSAAWASFARTGRPACDAAFAEWPTYVPSRRSTMVIGDSFDVVEDPSGEVRRVATG